MKRCSKCRIEKPIDGFYLHYGKPISACKVCTDAANRKWAKENPEKDAAIKARWVEKNPEKRQAALDKWAAENYEQTLEATAKWQREHLDQHAAKQAKRRAAKKQATPAWANDFFIEEAYALAKLRTEMTGFEWHVDHIVPLKSPKVCGLHVEFNLQVIPGKLNQSKNNRVWPDMPMEVQP